MNLVRQKEYSLVYCLPLISYYHIVFDNITEWTHQNLNFLEIRQDCL